MRFKYGSYFGLTAIHAMFLQPREVNMLFQNINLKSSTTALIENLYFECCALKEVFSSEQQSANIPHVILKKDLTDPKVNQLINGLNCFLDQKMNSDAIDSNDLDALADLDSLTESETSGLEDISGTNFFGELPDKPDDNEQDFLDSSLAELDTSAAIDLNDVFGDMDSQALNDLELFNLPEEDLPPVTLSLYDYNNLIEWGKNEAPPENPVIRGYGGLISFMMKPSVELSEDELASIKEQIANLPQIPVGVTLPDTIPYGNKVLSATSLGFLKILYKKMMRDIDGTPFIDFFITRLAMLLYSSEAHDRIIFFANVDDFSRDKTIRGSNFFIANLQSKYLKTNRQAIKSNIDILLDNCNEALGLTSDENLQKAIREAKDYLDATEESLTDTQEMWEYLTVELIKLAKVPESLYLDNISSLTELVKQLAANELLRPLIESPTNLTLVLTLYAALHILICKDIFSSLNLHTYVDSELEVATPRDIQDACAEIFQNFVKETGICGLYASYEAQFMTTLRNLKTPLNNNTHICFKKDSVNYRMTELLKMHLISLKKRISKGA